MNIEKKNVKDLLPADYNPRKDLKPGDPEYEKLKRSIEQFGYVEPVIWNEKTGRVVGGHQRLKVLTDMGITEVDVVVVDMDTEKEKALNIALNKISGEWDTEKLALVIADLQGTDFDVSLTGFDPEELEDLFRDDVKGGVKEDDFDVEAALKKPTFSKAGDLWMLGEHRLFCGDSTKPETFDLLMNGKKANLVVTDPPYNVDYKGSAGKIKNDSMAEDQFEQFLLAAYQQISILTPTVLPSVRPLKRLASISPDAASGRSSRWFWAEAPTSGSTSRCSLAGRRKASTSGTPGVRNPPSGNLTSRRKTRITRL